MKINRHDYVFEIILSSFRGRNKFKISTKNWYCDLVSVNKLLGSYKCFNWIMHHDLWFIVVSSIDITIIVSQLIVSH